MKTKTFIQKTGAAALACSLLVLASCNKKDFELNKLVAPDWHPSIAAPLAYSSIQLNNLITFSDTGALQLQEDSNHFMTLYYESQIYSASVSDLLQLDDQQVAISAGVTDSIVLICAYAQFIGMDSVVTLPAFSDTIALSMPNGAEIETIELNGGRWNWNISSDFRHDITIDIVIPSITLNGAPFSQSILLDYTGTSPVVFSQDIDLTDYILDLSAATNGAANSVNLSYTATVAYNHLETVSSTDSIRFDMNFGTLDFRNVYGYLGNQVVDIPEDIMEFTTGGISMALVDPKMTLTINNSFGLPIDASFTKLDGGYDGGVISLTGIPTPIEFSYPRAGEEGQVKSTVVTVDASNSNLSEFLSSGLTSITFAGNSTTNPDGNVGTNFITDDGMFSVDMAVELPLYGSIANIGIVDTMTIDLSSITNIVESADFLLNVENEFPFDISLQVYFVDDNFNVLDSLMQSSQKLIPSSIVDANGELLSASSGQTLIAINKATLDNIKNSTQIILLGSIASANNGTTAAKLYSDYKMDFSLGLKVKL